MKVTTFNGTTILLSSLLNVIILQYAVSVLFREIFNDQVWAKRAWIVNSTPFVSLFAITNTHDVLFSAGLLLLCGQLARESKRKHESTSKTKYMFIGLLISFSNIGIFIALITLYFLYRIRKSYRLILITIPAVVLLVISLLVPSLAAPTWLGMSSLLGDVKCAVQNPKNNLDEVTLTRIEQFGSLEEWKKPYTCRSADFAFFSGKEVEKNPKEFVKIWIKVFEEAPYTVMMARIQRASNFLPPLIFRAPSNSFDTNYSNPVGKYAADKSLLISPQIFYPGQPEDNDKLYKMWRNMGMANLIEVPAIVIAFLFNQNSSLLGWTGLWLTAGLIIIRIARKRIGPAIIAAPLICNHLILILVTPAPEPRYAMSSIIFTLIVTLGLIKTTDAKI
jgi:hypothetical protein